MERNKSPHALERGFTLIELIIVIIILSILAVVALPRLISLKPQAEQAVLLGTLGSLRSTARIAESAAEASGFNETGYVEIKGKTFYFYNGFPVARNNNISSIGPGSFSGILQLMEVEGDIKVYYSDATPIVSDELVKNDYVILVLNGQCVSYRPPQTSGELPEYSDGVQNFNADTITCSQ